MIGSLLILNATVGFSQEAKAGSVVNALKQTLTHTCSVIRGCPMEIKSRDLVPGDIVQLDEGCIVPADGRLITPSAHLQIDQSALTGESLAVMKTTGSTLLQSSVVRRGEALMMVTATGDSTFVGRSASLVNAAASDTGHFTQIIHHIGVVLLGLVLIVLFILCTSGFTRSLPTRELLEHTLVITNIGVPVGLPAVVTTTMAVGAAFLARKRAIVQKLSAIESLAGVEMLCSDKYKRFHLVDVSNTELIFGGRTGTLTKNKLTIGDIHLTPGISPDDIMLTACLAASRTRKGLDAIDQAFLKALKNYDVAMHALPRYNIVEFSPFNPVTKMVSAVAERPGGGRFTCVKGAPSAIASLLSRDGSADLSILHDYNDRVQDFAKRGFRSIGVARKPESGPWQLLGIVPCLDPPRIDTVTTINEAKELGLGIKMLTGDAVGIAKETSHQLGLGDNIYSPERIGLRGGGTMPGSQLHDFVTAADGFAEVFPQHKYDVVEILQRRGYLVAMTGDGVNDAPALKKADTGIAVEGASDAARTAADIVFLAPGLSAIIDAIKTSRQIFHRMYAYMVYRIALSIHLLIFLTLWILIWGECLDPTLVAFIAMFADVATLAIAYDKASFSKTPVKWNFFRLWTKAIVQGLILVGGSLICMITMRPSIPNPATGFTHLDAVGIISRKGDYHAIMFLQIVLTESFTILVMRAGKGNLFPSWQLAGAVLLVDALATLFCLFGWFQRYNKTDPVTVVRVWIFSLIVFGIMAIIHYVLSEALHFERVKPRKAVQLREEDLGKL